MIETLAFRPLFVLKLQVGYDRIQDVGQVPPGLRRVFIVDGGTFEGERLRGEVMPGGADWVLWRADGAMMIDVRIVLRTDDGALIGMQYTGIATAGPEVMARFNRREVVPYAEYYVRTTPRFETAAPAYAWLNGIVAVGNGARTAGGPVYHVFEIA
jgi:hypothetical protein